MKDDHWLSLAVRGIEPETFRVQFLYLTMKGKRPKWDTTESHRQTCYLIWLPSFWLYKPCQSIFQQLHYALLQHTPYGTLIVRVLATDLSSPYCHITPRLGDAPLARTLFATSKHSSSSTFLFLASSSTLVFDPFRTYSCAPNSSLTTTKRFVSRYQTRPNRQDIIGWGGSSHNKWIIIRKWLEPHY